MNNEFNFILGVKMLLLIFEAYKFILYVDFSEYLFKVTTILFYHGQKMALVKILLSWDDLVSSNYGYFI